MTTLLIAITSIIIALLLAAVCYRQHQRQQAQLALINDLQNQLSVLTAGTVHTDEQMLTFARTISKLKEQHGNLTSSVAPQHNYEHAIRLAKKGAARSQLVDTCNLSDEEAHLIERMHGDGEYAH